jgi:hypothetical protein
MIVICLDCVRLHEQLQKQAGEMYGLRKTITNLKKELKGERRKLEHMRKKNEKIHLRKGQKRSHFGRN